MRDVVALELRHRLVEGPLREPLRHEVQDHWNVLRPLLGARKPRIERELALSDHRAEPLEEVLGRRREDDPSPVLRLKSTTWPARVLKPAALADDALPAVERRRVLHDAEGRLVERRVDPLPLASRVAVAERGHDAERREEPGHVVRIPQRSRTPGRKFSRTTSHRGTSRRTMSCPFGVCRSRVMSFLFRLSTANQYVQPSSDGPRRRRSSPRPGISVLITSA